jgi:hypothetical protein|nr:MAG TPA_asm: hypothetical protein [Caudoviricetes sp.]
MMNLTHLENRLGSILNKAPQVAEFEVSASFGYKGQIKIDFMLCPLEKNGLLTCRKTQKLFSFEKQGQAFQIGIFSPCGLSWQELGAFLDLYALKITQICDEFARAENERKDSFLSEFFSASFAPTLTFAKGI